MYLLGLIRIYGWREDDYNFTGNYFIAESWVILQQKSTLLWWQVSFVVVSSSVWNSAHPPVRHQVRRASICQHFVLMKTSFKCHILMQFYFHYNQLKGFLKTWRRATFSEDGHVKEVTHPWAGSFADEFHKFFLPSPLYSFFIYIFISWLL